MNITINIHGASKITAESGTGCGAEWVDLEITSGRERSTICLFFSEPGKAERFAARFNYAAAEAGVQAEADRIKALPHTRRPAGHTDAFAIQDDAQHDYQLEREGGAQ